MTLPDHLVSPLPALLGWALALGTVLWAAYRAPWDALRQAPWRINLILLSVAFLLAMWSLKATLMPGLTLHFLGMATVTLVIGLELSLIAGFAAALILPLLFGGGMAIAGWDMVLSVLLPASITFAITRASQRWMMPNFFVYLFVGVFLSAVIGVIAQGIGTTLLVMALGLYDFDIIWNNYLRVLPLLAFPEGVVNGMIMTALVLVTPGIVISFDDHHYIDGR